VTEFVFVLKSDARIGPWWRLRIILPSTTSIRSCALNRDFGTLSWSARLLQVFPELVLLQFPHRVSHCLAPLAVLLELLGFVRYHRLVSRPSSRALFTCSRALRAYLVEGRWAVNSPFVGRWKLVDDKGVTSSRCSGKRASGQRPSSLSASASPIQVLSGIHEGSARVYEWT
jgi:hypothetical protein